MLFYLRGIGKTISTGNKLCVNLREGNTNKQVCVKGREEVGAGAE